MVQPNLLRHIWLRRLPTHVQTVLANRPELSLEQISDLADEIVEIFPLSTVHAVPNTSCQIDTSDNNNILDAIKQLSLEVDELRSRHNQKPQRPRSRSRQNSSNRSRKSTDSSERLCWYHTRFGKKSRKCIFPYQGNVKDSPQRTAYLPSSSRLSITDQITKHLFLVDTGSDSCYLPKRLLRDRRSSTDFQLKAANNSLIKTYDFLKINLNLGLRRQFV